jgi:hypothetical protein
MDTAETFANAPPTLGAGPIYWRGRCLTSGAESELSNVQPEGQQKQKQKQKQRQQRKEQLSKRTKTREQSELIKQWLPLWRKACHRGEGPGAGTGNQSRNADVGVGSCFDIKAKCMGLTLDRRESNPKVKICDQKVDSVADKVALLRQMRGQVAKQSQAGAQYSPSSAVFSSLSSVSPPASQPTCLLRPPSIISVADLADSSGTAVDGGTGAALVDAEDSS